MNPYSIITAIVGEMPSAIGAWSLNGGGGSGRAAQEQWLERRSEGGVRAVGVAWDMGHCLAREESLCRGLTQGRNRACSTFNKLREGQSGWTIGYKAEGGARKEAGKGSKQGYITKDLWALGMFLKVVGRHWTLLTLENYTHICISDSSFLVADVQGLELDNTWVSKTH